MQLLLIAQSQLCLLGSVEINFYITFEHYDLTNGMTSTLKIWFNSLTNSEVQDLMVDSTKKPIKIDSYLHLCKRDSFL